MNGNDKSSRGVTVFREEIIWYGSNVLSFFIGIIVYPYEYCYWNSTIRYNKAYSDQFIKRFSR